MENEQTVLAPTDILNTKENSPIQPEKPKSFWKKAVERIKTSKEFYGYYLAIVVVLSQLPIDILLGFYDLVTNSDKQLFSLEIFYLSTCLISFFVVLILLNRIIYKILFFILSFIVLVLVFLKLIEGKDTSGLMGIYIVPVFILGIMIVVLTLEHFRNNKYVVWLVKILFIITVIGTLGSYFSVYIGYKKDIKNQEKKLEMKALSQEKFEKEDYTTPTEMLRLCKASELHKDSECHTLTAVKFDDINMCLGGGNNDCIKQYLSTKEIAEYQSYCDRIQVHPDKAVFMYGNDTYRAFCYSMVKPEAKFDISTFCINDNNDSFAFCNAGLGKIAKDWIYCEDTRLVGKKKESCYGLMMQAFNYAVHEEDKPRQHIPSTCVISKVNNREKIDCPSILN